MGLPTCRVHINVRDCPETLKPAMDRIERKPVLQNLLNDNGPIPLLEIKNIKMIAHSIDRHAPSKDKVSAPGLVLDNL
jgi:hypothetical protein